LTSNRFRIAAAGLLILILAIAAAGVLPVYLRNMELQTFVEDLTRRADAGTLPDDGLRIQILEKARRLNLPVQARNVHISRSNGTPKIEVRYTAPVEILFYRVDLHFYPGAGGK
jgi:hypothetical protein